MSRITPGFKPSNEMFLSAMEVSETAVICCPSVFTARWAGGACFSTVSNEAYTATTGCQLQFASRIETVLLETYTFYGRPITGLMAYTTATTMSFKTTIETIKPADSTQYIGLVTTTAVTLVHKQSDVGETPLTGKTSPTST
ncbi:unnamed protein product [Colletotrichum noveboracense]|uniref:Uncharacterized protein n=1 Tax=Colletotrichum noveboracense TaxID=2664923 RepID=A0A9W4RQV4_9PEZI|nr:unnamed protein product [Colletotrichum noveboracense]